MEIDIVIQNLNDVKQNIDGAIKTATEIKNDPLFVSFDISTDNQRNKMTQIKRWFRQNNISATFDIILPLDGYSNNKIDVPGYKFKNEEDAMAFKLRWI